MKMRKENDMISYSQNFLYNNNLVSKLINMSSLDENDIVFEIGAGNGIITKELSRRCKKVVAYEKDSRLAKRLTENLKQYNNIEIKNEDFLSTSLSLSYGCKFFSNIPFNITADILTKVFSSTKIEDIYFIMQYEAFLKYAGRPYYKECLKSLLYKPFYDMQIMHRFQATDFRPVPRAKIILARFTPKDVSDIPINEKEDYFDFLSYVFNKNGENFKEKGIEIFSYAQIKRICMDVGMREESNVTNIQFEQWLYIYDVYKKIVSQGKKKKVKGAYKRLLKEQSRLDKIHRNRCKVY